jgi:hypothetical protein
MDILLVTRLEAVSQAQIGQAKPGQNGGSITALARPGVLESRSRAARPRFSQHLFVLIYVPPSRFCSLLYNTYGTTAHQPPPTSPTPTSSSLQRPRRCPVLHCLVSCCLPLPSLFCCRVRFGRSPLCRSIGLAHGLDRAGLQCLTVSLSDSGPKSLGPFKRAFSVLPRSPWRKTMSPTHSSVQTRRRSQAADSKTIRRK